MRGERARCGLTNWQTKAIDLAQANYTGSQTLVPSDRRNTDVQLRIQLCQGPKATMPSQHASLNVCSLVSLLTQDGVPSASPWAHPYLGFAGIPGNNGQPLVGCSAAHRRHTFLLLRFSNSSREQPHLGSHESSHRLFPRSTNPPTVTGATVPLSFLLGPLPRPLPADPLDAPAP